MPLFNFITVQELSSYTHILEEEILQIMGLSEDTKRVAVMPEPQPEQMDAENSDTIINNDIGRILRGRGRNQ